MSDCFYLDALFNQTYARHNNETLEKRPKPAENTIIELVIVPDRSGGEARASLAQLRLG